MILPRADYEIVDDSWDVVGLRGTGSKDVIVKDAFVPHHRAMNALEVMDGTTQRESGQTQTLYQMPWSTMFPLGITSAVIGIAEGALAAHLDYQRDRVTAARAVMAVDQIFSRSGGNAMRMDNPLQRYWRDAHAGLAHAIHVPGTTFHASALSSFGVDPVGPLRAMI